MTKTLHQHVDNPGWGRGIIVAEHSGKVFLRFEDGKERAVSDAPQYRRKLVPADVPNDEAQAIVAQIIKGAAQAKKSTSKGGVKPEKARRAARYSFEQQLAWFEGFFDGGFLGDTFIEEERGRHGVEGHRGYKQAAITLAQTKLTETGMATMSVDEVFDVAKRLVGMTNIPFRTEGPIRFGQMDAAARPGFASALRDLLFSQGEYAARLDRLVDSLRLVDATGKATSATWPLVTLFHAFVDPANHVPVKPMCFMGEAAVLDVALELRGTPKGAVYAHCVELVRRVHQRLVHAGHQPRDLMDVYSFMYRTHEVLGR